MRRTLTAELAGASLALGAVVIGIVLTLLILVAQEEEKTESVRRAGDRALAATELRGLVVDLQAGQRGYLLTRERRFLEPFDAARRRWRSRSGARLLADVGPERDLLRTRIDSLIDDYLEPTIRLFPRDPLRVRLMVRSGLGKRRVDVLRDQLGNLIGAARRDRIAALDELRRAERRARTVALIGLLVASLLVVLFCLYLVRSVVRPVQRVSAAARAMSGGDLRARVAGGEERSAELLDMAAAFNQMASALESRTGELEQRYDEVRLEVARAATLQRQLLPERPPPGARIELAGACLPAADVGGDYFDYLVDDRGRVTLLIADVAGHGIASALLMAMVRQVVRREVLAGAAPDEVLRAANAELHDDLVTVELFVTAFCARIDRGAGVLQFANGGHNRPFLRRSDGTVSELDADGMAIGLLADAPFEAGETAFAAGDAVVLFTDGVVEAEDPDGRPLGDRRLQEMVEGMEGTAPESAVALVVGAVREHVAGRPVRDDVTVVVGRHPGGT
jgi:serine phosphatase RsbU (regulator of sigma subunit)/CHASE3 domain sensor protein